MVNRKQFEEICNKYGLDSKKLIKIMKMYWKKQIIIAFVMYWTF